MIITRTFVHIHFCGHIQAHLVTNITTKLLTCFNNSLIISCLSM
jgi:hypothetical protein